MDLKLHKIMLSKILLAVKFKDIVAQNLVKLNIPNLKYIKLVSINFS